MRKSEVSEMPSLPRGGGDDLVRDEQVSSRRVRRVRYLTACFPCLTGGVCILTRPRTEFLKILMMAKTVCLCVCVFVFYRDS